MYSVMEYYSDYMHAKMYVDIYYSYEIIECNVYKIYYPEKCDNEFLQFNWPELRYFYFYEYWLEVASKVRIKHNIKYPSRYYSCEYDINNGRPLYIDQYYRYGILKKSIEHYRDHKITRRYLNGVVQSTFSKN